MFYSSKWPSAFGVGGKRRKSRQKKNKKGEEEARGGGQGTMTPHIEWETAWRVGKASVRL